MKKLNLFLLFLVCAFLSVSWYGRLSQRVLSSEDSNNRREDGNNGNGHSGDENNRATITATPTPTATPAVIIFPVGEITTVYTDQNVSPTVTETPSEAKNSEAKTETNSTTNETTQTNETKNETQTVSQNTSNFFSNIIQSVIKPKVTPRVTPKITPPVEEKALEVVEAASILRNLGRFSSTALVPDNSKTRLRFEVLPTGTIGVLAENGLGQTIGLSGEMESRIKNVLNENVDLRVGRSSDGGFEFGANVVAKTELPLLIDLNDNLLSVETSTGVKQISILPKTAQDQALIGEDLSSIGSERMTLVERTDGKLAYQISGLKNYRLFGIWPVTRERKIEVSAHNGAVFEENGKTIPEFLFGLIAR